MQDHSTEIRRLAENDSGYLARTDMASCYGASLDSRRQENQITARHTGQQRQLAHSRVSKRPIAFQQFDRIQPCALFQFDFLQQCCLRLAHPYTAHPDDAVLPGVRNAARAVLLLLQRQQLDPSAPTTGDVRKSVRILLPWRDRMRSAVVVRLSCSDDGRTCLRCPRSSSAAARPQPGPSAPHRLRRSQPPRRGRRALRARAGRFRRARRRRRGGARLRLAALSARCMGSNKHCQNTSDRS